ERALELRDALLEQLRRELGVSTGRSRHQAGIETRDGSLELFDPLLEGRLVRGVARRIILSARREDGRSHEQDHEKRDWAHRHSFYHCETPESRSSLADRHAKLFRDINNPVPGL